MLTNIERVAAILGGPVALGSPVTDLRGLRVRVERGLPVKSLDSLARYLARSDREAAAIKFAIVPKQTLARRRRLTREESECVGRLASIIALAEYVWENADHARTFLLSEQLPLGGARPIDLARSERGAREVEEVLERLEYSLPA